VDILLLLVTVAAVVPLLRARANRVGAPGGAVALSAAPPVVHGD
jgi:hypothetical protein